MQNKSVLVLGGTGDIGQAIASRFESCQAVGSRDCDLSSKDSVEQFISHNGPWHTIIHCAGYNQPKRFELDSQEHIDKNIQINLLGFMPIIRKNIEYWRTVNSGKLIIIDSLYGQFGRQGRLAYAASKHALLGLTKTLAIELAEYNVLVNAVSPGYIMTKMTSKNNTPDTINKLVANIPMQRLGRPEEVADITEYLASDRNSYITGQNIVIDGGYTAGGFQQ